MKEKISYEYDLIITCKMKDGDIITKKNTGIIKTLQDAKYYAIHFTAEEKATKGFKSVTAKIFEKKTIIKQIKI